MSSATTVTDARAALPGHLPWRRAEVTDKQPETPGAATLLLDVEGWAGHRAGQHVDVRLTAEDGYRAQRSYSIGSSPGQRQVALTVERLDDGEVSPYLVDEARPGDQFELRGPLGGWFTWTPEDGGPLLLVAGGSGLVPLMSMIRDRHAAGSSVPVRLLLSARSLDDVIYRRELDDLAAADGGLELIVTLTRLQPDGWTGFARRVDAGLLAEVAWPADSGARTFICGPTAFVETAAEALVGLGHPAASVKTERFGATGS